MGRPTMWPYTPDNGSITARSSWSTTRPWTAWISPSGRSAQEVGAIGTTPSSWRVAPRLSAPPMPGGEHARLLRSLADAAALRDAAKHADTAVVIGTGFIGCEAAASLALRGSR